MNWRKIIAKILSNVGIRPTYSHNIAGELTCGYGKLDDYGFWQFPLDPQYRPLESKVIE